jgi:molecular chaperone GrpE
VRVDQLRTGPGGTVRVVNRRLLFREVLETLDVFIEARIRSYERQLTERVREREETARDEGQMRVLTSLADLLDVVETVVDTLDGGRESTAGRALSKRVGRVFQTYGFERIPTVGEAFDPRWHEAVDTEASADHETNEIVREVSAGFRRGEFVLRVARVTLAE